MKRLMILATAVATLITSLCLVSCQKDGEHVKEPEATFKLEITGSYTVVNDLDAIQWNFKCPTKNAEKITIVRKEKGTLEQMKNDNKDIPYIFSLIVSSYRFQGKHILPANGPEGIDHFVDPILPEIFVQTTDNSGHTEYAWANIEGQQEVVAGPEFELILNIE